MTKFNLIQKSANKVLAKFHVQNQRGDIIGSINVPCEQASDLLRHWNGANDRLSGEQHQPGFRSPLKLKPLSRAAILRCC
jgi:hypothetical protein